MNKATYQQERDIALAAVREAVRLCRAVQAQISPQAIEKSDRSPVTVADFGSQALVCSALQDAFPQDPIMAEEDARVLRQPEHASILEQVVYHVRDVRPGVDAGTVCRWIDYGNLGEQRRRFWTLDPIDGTKGFLRGDQYAIALALLVDEEVVVAALACPNLPDPSGGERGVVYAAIRGEGTMSWPLDRREEPSPVHVSTLGEAARARFCESVEASHSSHSDAALVARHLGLKAAPVRLDSQAKYAVVARGEADFYLRLPTRPGYVEKIWDHAAGSLIVREAGGRVSDVSGQPLKFRHGPQLETNRGVVVTNGALHQDVLGALDALGIP